MANFAFVATALLLAHVPVEATRVTDFVLSRTKENHTATQGLGCQNYCVQCSDGSTVFYGREMNWWKAGTGGIGYFAAALGARAIGMGGDEQNEETHTNWKGTVPTSGLFCERMDVIKFNTQENCDPVALMRMSEQRYGRVMNNMLKPYDSDGNSLGGFRKEDRQAYKKGCEVLKGSGMKGSIQQFRSMFQASSCKNKVAKAAKKCSEHSKICGNQGYDGFIKVKNVDDCLDACVSPSKKLYCTIPA